MQFRKVLPVKVPICRQVNCFLISIVAFLDLSTSPKYIAYALKRLTFKKYRLYSFNVFKNIASFPVTLQGIFMRINFLSAFTGF